VDWRFGAPGVESLFRFVAIVGSGGGTVETDVGIGLGTRARGGLGGSMPSQRRVKRVGGRGRDVIGSITQLIPKKPLRIRLAA
jgi:hypothetical protein